MDFDCKCTNATCRHLYIDTDLVLGLDLLHDLFPQITINSGFRCTAHNKAVGGKAGSFHLLGKAADIRSQFADPTELYYAADKLSVFNQGGVGIYTNFIHVDVRGYRSRWNLGTILEQT